MMFKQSRLRLPLTVYLLVATALGWLSLHLDGRFRTETGLVHTFYRETDSASIPLFRRTSRGIDLDFLEDEPSLPRRSFRVQWKGVWHLPEARLIDIYAGGDDRVVVRVDDRVVVARGAARGMHTIAERVALDAGFHRVVVRYEQYGGDFGLNVRWARAGEVPRSFESASIFPERPDDAQLKANRRLATLRRVAGAVWLVPPLLFALWVGWPHALRAGRRVFQSWCDRSRLTWRRWRQEGDRPVPWPAEPTARQKRALQFLYVVVVVGFLGAVGQFYRPGTGFTYLIFFGEEFQERTLSTVEAVPHYVHRRGSFGYDGQFYAQLAVAPLLDDPGLQDALDSAPYRARRILFSWTAFALGLGQPGWVLQAYALQNVLCWVILAWLLQRWLPPARFRNFALWFACLFSHGMIVSVRRSLLEGPSMLLIVLGLLALEHRRTIVAAGIVGLSGLGRETNLLVAAALAGSGGWSARARARAFVAAGLVAVPLLLWFAYTYSVYGSRVLDGGGNLTMPLAGLWQYWESTLGELRMVGWASRARYSLLALVSLAVQAGYLIWRVDWDDHWWRVGISYCALMLLLSINVWEGYPGASTRVLLPMAFAFNVLLPQSRYFWLLFVFGNLTVVQSLADLGMPRLV